MGKRVLVILVCTLLFMLFKSNSALACCTQCDCVSEEYSFKSQGISVEVPESQLSGLLVEKLEGARDRHLIDICNSGEKQSIWISLLYLDADPSWRTQGWWEIKRNQCVNLFWGGIHHKLYIHISESSAWSGGQVEVCIDPKNAFNKIVDGDQTCSDTNNEWRRFNPISPNVTKGEVIKIDLKNY